MRGIMERLKRLSLTALAVILILNLAACGTEQKADVPADGGAASAEQTELRPDADPAAGSGKSSDEAEKDADPEENYSPEAEKSASSDRKEPEETDQTEEETVEKTLHLYIDGSETAVTWESNASVDALAALAEAAPLTIPMSGYGGFEQVGSIGSRLPSKDVRITTSAGDIVLYSSSQIVIFYGHNTWEYTRLGKVSDKTAAEMKELLRNGDVTLTVSYE